MTSRWRHLTRTDRRAYALTAACIVLAAVCGFGAGWLVMSR